MQRAAVCVLAIILIGTAGLAQAAPEAKPHFELGMSTGVSGGFRAGRDLMLEAGIHKVPVKVGAVEEIVFGGFSILVKRRF